MILADLTIGGRAAQGADAGAEERLLLRARPRHRRVHLGAPFAEVTWATGVDQKTGRPIETPNARYLKPELVKPAPLGAHNWQPMSFNPKTGLVYIPAQEIPFAFGDDPKFTSRPAAGTPASTSTRRAASRRAQSRGHLLAWDPVAQKEGWRASYESPWNGGTLTTAGNLVFQGTADGPVRRLSPTPARRRGRCRPAARSSRRR